MSTPQTPAEVASAILDAIEEVPDAFSMNSWISLPSLSSLPPTGEPSCGTTMCVAGWAAHLTGWTLVDDGTIMVIPDADGVDTAIDVYAVKGDTARLVDDVARDLLGPDISFYADADTALEQLRVIAGR
ncbi:hypothetical protein ACIOHE_39245 [Streptomyces sp. NPDC087851]|uniref:hypothetical protein n=1 Tax=Streptomyces sp. NPDC087851 TaxID=3365810 RepID=UPI0037F73148